MRTSTFLPPLLVAGTLLPNFAACTAQPSAASEPSLSIEQLLQIRHPSRPAWSPDGSHLAFIWDDAGAQNIYVVDAMGDSSPVAITSYETGIIDVALRGPSPLFWSTNDTVAFARSGTLWRVRADGSDQPEAVFVLDSEATTQALSLGLVGSSFTPSPDGGRVAFVAAGDIWVHDLAANVSRNLTDSPTIESNPGWSPDGSRLVFVVTESVRHDEAYEYVGAKISFSRLEGWMGDVAVIPVAGGPIRRLGATGGAESAPQWLDDSRVVLQRLTEDQTTREIVLVEVGSGSERVLHRDIDDKWWSLSYLGADPLPSPDGRFVSFLSDREGWNHVYVVATDGGEAKRITEGDREHSDLAWSPDSTTLVFSFNETATPGTRHLAVVRWDGDRDGDLATTTPVTTTLTNGQGTNTSPVLSPDGSRMVFQHTDPRSSADLFVMPVTDGSQPRRLTSSMPDDLDRSALIEPELVRYPAEDGARVPAYLFVSPELDRSRRHPAIVWIHGDGVNQNYDGWHIQRNYAVYYSFHQYLAQRGYVVLAVDYRGSIGYGKEWRQGHFRDLGGRDYLDVASGMDFLETLGYVDTERVGVWGLSYGGFMTLQALTVTPELFRCGVNVAGVADWRTWHRDPGGPWIQGRMGTPAENVDLYRRTASIESIDRIERPLLVMHGTADVNVPFTESVRLVDVLTKHGKDYEFVMYPGEFHYFQREHVLRDAWQRVERFFDEHLRLTRS